MGERVFEMLRAHFAVHGYWTVAFVLLLENSGIPVPGETVLLFASFLAYSEHRLYLPYIIATGVAAATLGDNLGYAIGHKGGRPLLDRYKHLFRIPERHIRKGEHLFARYGSFTVFFARFIFGMRILAGPLAGVLRMPWKRFALFNFLGATLWVSVISTVGFLFGTHWGTLIRVLKEFDMLVFAVVALVIALLWWRRRRSASDAGEGS
jgi:membrane protein DedA with SNARE-associated domain